HDLREGWHDFISRRWLWPIVLAFGFIVAVSTATTSVLGPLVAHTELGGARSWGIILAAYAAGPVLGGMVMLRFRPRRTLVAAGAARGDAVGAGLFGVPLRAGRAPRGGVGRRGRAARGRLPGGVQRQLGDDHATGDPAGHALPAVLLRPARQLRPGTHRRRGR